MSSHTEFGYVQARLQARHGAMVSAPGWQALESSHTAGHYLALTRAGPLANWVEGLDETRDVHRVERHLRARWRAYVAEVARWAPPRWQPAVVWFGALVELPLIDDLSRRGLARHWLRHDEHLARFVESDPSARAQGLQAAGLAPWAAAGRTGDAVSVWFDEWQRRLPGDAGARTLLRRPAEVLLPRLGAGGGARAAAQEPPRRALERLFRRHAATAVAVFAHLALVALDLERLRGGMVARILFEPEAGLQVS